MDSRLDKDMLRDAAARHGTPLFVYSRQFLQERAKLITSLELPYGFTPRYAVKANSHPEIIDIFAGAGLSFDVSSSYEADMLLRHGIEGSRISLSSQQPAHNLKQLLDADVRYVATSTHQLELFAGVAEKGSELGLRVNPGIGEGHNSRTTTGGVNSSFGLWGDYVPDALKFVREHSLSVTTLHIHIGSGADPKVWEAVVSTALDIARDMPDVRTLDIGGGYKIHRYADEHETDMVEIAAVFAAHVRGFAEETGRQLHLEIEPGTWLVAHAGVLLASIVDIVDTGDDGHTFLRLNTGMNDFLRPSMYGAQHEIEVLNDETELMRYVVVGHNCETGDILTPAPGDPEGIESRELCRARIGDVIAIRDTGAYSASMSAKGYNSYPSAGEVVI